MYVYTLGKCGTSSTFMQPVFPSKTFPNHYSIVTVSIMYITVFMFLENLSRILLGKIQYDTTGGKSPAAFTIGYELASRSVFSLTSWMVVLSCG